METRDLPDDFAVRAVSGAGVSVRPMVAGDLDDVTRAASDPGIWAGHPAQDRWKPKVFEGYFQFLLTSGGAVVLCDGDGGVIGMSRYYASSDAPEGIGIGFTFLVRSHWGGATNLAVKRLMLNEIFHNCPEAWFHIAPSNIRSQKATAKLGAERMDDRRLDLGTGPADWVRMRLTRALWQARSAG